MFSVARCFTVKKLGGISRFMFTVHNPLVSTVRNGASRDSMNLQACTRTYRIVQTRAGYLTRLYPTMLIARRRRHGQGPLLPPLPVFSHEYNNGPRPRIHVPRNLSGAACLPACPPPPRIRSSSCPASAPQISATAKGNGCMCIRTVSCGYLELYP